LLEAEIVDRDYSNSTSTPSMKKAIKFAIFYKLRCANGFCLMVMIVEILKKKCIKHIQNNHFFLKKILSSMNFLLVLMMVKLLHIMAL
jgi:hypothetical protein